MKTSALCIGLLMVVAAAILAQDGPQDTKLDPSKLVGKWEYVSGKRHGDQVDKERLKGTVTFNAETIILPAGPDEKFVMAYKVNANANPATIDIEIKSGAVNEGKARGIIKLDGDQMTLCYIPGEEMRPKTFESTQENGAFLFTLKKVK